MNLFAATLPALIPLAATLLPGLFMVRWTKQATTFIPQLARAILWSIAINSMFALLLSALSLPPALTFLISPLIFFLFIPRRLGQFDQRTTMIVLTSLLLFLVAYGAFSLPFLTFHSGLPTGDSQKSIYWATSILAHQALPDYASSIAQLNRDPVDFYTPALHALTAAVMQTTLSFSDPLTAYISVGFLAIALSLSVVIIAQATVTTIATKPVLPLALFITPVILLTHLRFLRYLREPGYHLQNVAGELLIFGGLFLLLSLLRKPRHSDFFLLILVLTTLFLTHQFSAFLAAFVLLPPSVALVYSNWGKIKSSMHLRHSSSLFFLLALSIFILGWALKLLQKIPHLFNAEPHLLSLTPQISDYFNLMGFIWLTSGLLGLVYVYYSSRTIIAKSFVVSTLLLLFLSQAPRLFIDIPPVRTLFYAIVPLSIAFALLFAWVMQRLYRLHTSLSLTTATLLILLVGLPMFFSIDRAFTLSHSVRTNSTLLPEHWPLISFLQTQTDGAAVLYDDYNRRSSSWLIMSKHPAFARLSSDLKVQMQEAKQSRVRQDLYLKQLDFEKIYMLGSHPAIAALLAKHNIKWLIGVNNSSAGGLTKNPVLQPVLPGSDLTLFTVPLASSETISNLSDHSHWLIRPTTLVNDIGDSEDTFLHLPASLRSTRLSPAQTNNNATYRTTTAPLIPLFFNVRDYVSVLWDQDDDGYADNSIQLSIKTIDSIGQLNISYGDNHSRQILADGTQVTIPAPELPLSAAYVVITIDNPAEQPIDLDLVALGLSRTP
ncbi:MAG: hypothetical protein A3E37_05120 [Candidatus Andersenbacteria bacterium RIFCSPHIGHO2_12_FULL_46_9]|nr:MAG: hypothetical protein UW94_C0003G0103 [Parcubacteria group bacterium GW2011_GWA2_45_14]OGY33741.1 MAG: hypothetical protein A3B76_02675 [Candidatus Andersenbacteria bacterium RIFCSPHIGHO2_02_FULL_46_16]OGY36176.1 MAG: hypothetical protein A3I08_04995 [Candidatus Andersenbacteria bacterium RIFCSPLOWO2_02_FULL_46_11]OGY36987.1 MAG: hypothetical protein A3E37_05120 [Candidatus Andersenbacteria bacterium RIFCSPHIGHO2_12_FULL_46_9]OGY38328.1 MAG: hypothetical protein A3G57_00970 [Candidatus A